MADGMFINIIV